MRPLDPTSAPSTVRPASLRRPLRGLMVASLAAGALAVGGMTACARGPVPTPGGPAVESPVPAAELEAELRALVDGFRGAVGIYARRLGTPAAGTHDGPGDGESGGGGGDGSYWARTVGAPSEVAIAADEIYPTASMVKVPLLVGLMERVEAGEVALDDRVVYDDSLFYPSEGDVINKLRPGETTSVENLAVQMIVRSDNTASLWIQGMVGGVTVNEWLAARGFDHTRVNSRVDGRRGDWEVYGWGQSTPREMARLMTTIRDGEAVSPASSEWMFRLLSRAWWPDGATSQIPPGVNVASKPGAVSAARSEVLVVNAPAGDYVLCIMTREQEDTSWVHENEGEALIRAVSRAVWEAWGTPVLRAAT